MLKRIGLAVMLTAIAGSAGAKVKGCGPSTGPFKADVKCVMKAPEIDPSSAVAGLTLLAGGIAVMLGRRSKRLQPQAE